MTQLKHQNQEEIHLKKIVNLLEQYFGKFLPKD